jgi:C4-type Zn-finger protein
MARKKLGIMGVTCDGCDYKETEVVVREDSCYRK